MLHNVPLAAIALTGNNAGPTALAHHRLLLLPAVAPPSTLAHFTKLIKTTVMRFDILTLFPEIFPGYLDASIIDRALQQKLLDVQLWNIRDYSTNKHHTVDDTPYGGGPGMVMKVEPIDAALRALETQNPKSEIRNKKVVVLSARGRQFTQAVAEEYSKLDYLTLICGRYEGIDQRVVDYLADEELSVGPYVLAGGELAALVVIEAVARLVPGVLGNPESLAEESFSQGAGVVFKEYPQYTKPEDYNGWKVPEVLLSGNHAEIKKWREAKKRSTL